MFQVRSTNPDAEGNDMQPPYYVESTRVSEKDAKQDMDLLKLFGKTAWIVEVA